MYRLRLTLILALAASSACTFHKSKTSRVFVPPAVRPEPAATAVPPIPSAPDIEANPLPDAPEVGTGTLPTAGPPPPTAVRRPAAPRAVATPTPAAPTAEPAPAPRLETILTADQLRDYNRSMDESLDRVKKVLAAVAGRSLKPELATIVNRIQTFQKQAEQARELDLVTAVNLARRADLLAQDLIKRLP